MTCSKLPVHCWKLNIICITNKSNQKSSLNNVAKTTILLADMADFQTVNSIYAKYFSQTLPARSTFAVKALPKNAKVEIEGVAFGKKECRNTQERLEFLENIN